MSISLSEKLFANKPYLGTVEVLGRKFTFRTLGGAEENEIVSMTNSQTLFALYETRKIPTLARAITNIDGASWRDFDEIKQRLASNPGMTLVQAVEAELRQPKYTEEVISAIYIAYADFRGKYREQLQSLKKSSTPTNPEPVG